MRLRFSNASGRYCIGGYELHCGDCFQLNLDGQWKYVRIEHCDLGWFLVGLPPHVIAYCDCHENREARMY